MLFLPGLFKMLAAYTLLFLIASCTNKLPSEINQNNTPKEIIELGDEAYSKGYYERAGDYYSEVNTYFPYSIEDELGLSKAVEAYYRAGKFDESRLVASKFLSSYPESTRAQGVLYFRSKSFCDQIDIVERDQAAARDCIVSFSAFQQLYPKSDLSREAESNISRAKEFLVGQQLNVGKYYLKRNNPTAAMRRLKKIKKSTKGSDFLPEVSYRLIESFILVGLFREAISEKSYMEKKFPNSSWTREAYALVNKSGLD
ncbi:outer membrane protein assembly factor BamD [Paracoccaceae bacterium]|nr:outer membrane protein assembly factor BamD [Paracoccaceae bacterium]